MAIDPVRKKKKRPRPEADAPRDAKPKVKESSETRLNVRRMLEDAAAQKRGGDYLQLAPGENRVRFLMNPGSDTFYAARYTTYLPFGGATDKGQSVVSPRTADPAAYCPLTTVSDALHAIANDATSRGKRAKELRDAIRPRMQYLSNVLLYEGKQWRSGILQFGPQVFNGIVDSLKHQLDDDDLDGDYTETHNIAHPTSGNIVVIERKGQKLGTTYSVTLLSKTLPATKEQLATRTDLLRMCTPTDTAVLESALCQWFGVDSFDDVMEAIADNGKLPNAKTPASATPRGGDEDEDEEAPRKKKGKPAKVRVYDDEDEDDEEEAPRKKKRKPAPVVEDDEDEDDYDDEEDDEEDEEPAPRKKTSRKPAVVEDDEDEDEDDEDADYEDDEDADDEEEEDEAPPAKKRSATKARR